MKIEVKFWFGRRKTLKCACDVPQERRFYAVFAPMQKKIAAVYAESVRKLNF